MTPEKSRDVTEPASDEPVSGSWADSIERMRLVARSLGAEIRFTDNFVEGKPPYRYAQTQAKFPPLETDARLPPLARLAIHIGGYLTFSVHSGHVYAAVAISRPLTADEIAEATRTAAEDTPRDIK